MRKIALLLLLLITISGYCQNYTVDQPRLRVNRTTSLTLDNTWKTIEFNGTSTDNVNTFGINPINGNKMAFWDQTNKLFRFYGDYDQHFALQVFPTTTTTSLSLRATLQYRIVIPNGNGPGVDRYIPYPDAGGFADIAEVTVTSVGMLHNPIILFITSTQAIRTNGFYIQMKLNTNLTVGTCTLNNCALSIQSLK